MATLSLRVVPAPPLRSAGCMEERHVPDRFASADFLK